MTEPVDPDALRRFALTDDEQVLRDLYQEFLRANAGIALDIAQSIEGQELLTASRLAHRFKSSAGLIGARPLLELTEQLVAAARSEDQRATDQRFQDFRRELERVLAWVEARIA